MKKQDLENKQPVRSRKLTASRQTSTKKQSSPQSMESQKKQSAQTLVERDYHPHTPWLLILVGVSLIAIVLWVIVSALLQRESNQVITTTELERAAQEREAENQAVFAELRAADAPPPTEEEIATIYETIRTGDSGGVVVDENASETTTEEDIAEVFRILREENNATQ